MEDPSTQIRHMWSWSSFTYGAGGNATEVRAEVCASVDLYESTRFLMKQAICRYATSCILRICFISKCVLYVYFARSRTTGVPHVHPSFLGKSWQFPCPSTLEPVQLLHRSKRTKIKNAWRIVPRNTLETSPRSRVWHVRCWIVSCRKLVSWSDLCQAQMLDEFIQLQFCIWISYHIGWHLILICSGEHKTYHSYRHIQNQWEP